jgi:hypothetical protein
MAPNLDAAIADLKTQFEDALAPWQASGDETGRVVVERPAEGRWLFWLRTPRFVNCRLNPPHSLWVASKHISTKVPELSLLGVSYEGEHLLVVVVESKHRSAGKTVLGVVRDRPSNSSSHGFSFPRSAEPTPSELFNDPVRQIAAKRSFRALFQILQNADRSAVEDAASQSSDVAVIARALEQPEALETLTDDDPFAQARLSGVRERERLLSEEGGTWSVEQVAKHLQLTRQAVNRRRKQGALLGLDAGRHGFRYPAWQFTAQGTIEGLERVLAALGHLDPWMQQAFMLGKSARLKEARAIDVFRHGDVGSVVKAASAFGEHGAP